jgi:hypothetical protein
MKCHEAKRHLDLFMDGELSVPENLKVLEHVNLCRPCAGLYEGEKALRGVLRAGAASVVAPAGLAERLAGTAAPSVPAPQVAVLPRRRWLSYAAAAGFFLVLFTLIFTNPGEQPRAFATELASKHKETHDGFCGVHRDDCLCLCSRCSTESDNPAGKFFQRRVAFPSCSHDLKALGYAAVGVEVWEHRDRPVCWTVYHDAAGHSITHGLITTKIAKEPGPLLVCDGVDRPVVLAPSRVPGMTCAYVFDDRGEADRFRSEMNLR